MLRTISIDEQTNCTGTFFGDCVLSISKNTNERQAITVLSEGMVNSVRFENPVFGRKVRDQAWLNKWKPKRPNSNLTSFSGLKDWFKYGIRKIIQFLWWVSSDYGRRILPWVAWSLGFTLIFALSFWKLGTDHFTLNGSIIDRSFGADLYYSVVTFTTLGFGDITPKSYLGMGLVSLEVFTGYIMLGGLISIFATKFARRND